MKKIFIAFVLTLLSSIAFAQDMLGNNEKSERAQSLRGALTDLRTCYDINYYHLDVKIDIDNKSVSGSNEFVFTATKDFEKLQFDLFDNLKVEKVIFKGKELPFTREFAAVFVKFPKVQKGSKERFTVFYSGNPKVAKNAPWDGGFIFKKDKAGNPFVSVACQGLGASVWWPNKDHQSDEVDSMLISISAPKDLDCIANGRYRGKVAGKDGYTKHNWFVGNPINNYNIAFYIGKYAHWTDTYNGEDGKLTLDFYSLREDSAKARPHWDADVKPMLKSFEHWFGPYPWYKDGYKLVQAPHLGMEHQSAVAYGNQFLKGYMGKDLSGTGVGLKWDYITIHETGHEWFGNNITTKDIADMWVHEGFTVYSEVCFIESTQGKKAADDYVIGLRKIIDNKETIIGKYHMNSEGSGDMYFKGANLIHTIRQLINDDEKFRQILRGLNKTFYHATTTSADVEAYIAKQSGLKLDKVFDQYLRHANIPTLTYKIENGTLSYKWLTEVTGFDMPVKVSLKAGEYTFIKPNNDWQTTKVDSSINAGNFSADRNFYVNIKKAE
jgi:aminopeptidase N